jgi:hypothetical protein
MPNSVVPSSDDFLSVIDLPEKWQKELATKPETGMGFQEVEVATSGGGKVHGFVIQGISLETFGLVVADEIVSIMVKRGRAAT